MSTQSRTKCVYCKHSHVWKYCLAWFTNVKNAKEFLWALCLQPSCPNQLLIKKLLAIFGVSHCLMPILWLKFPENLSYSLSFTLINILYKELPFPENWITLPEDAVLTIARYDLVFQLRPRSGHSKKLEEGLQATVNSEQTGWSQRLFYLVQAFMLWPQEAETVCHCWPGHTSLFPLPSMWETNSKADPWRAWPKGFIL